MKLQPMDYWISQLTQERIDFAFNDDLIDRLQTAVGHRICIVDSQVGQITGILRSLGEFSLCDDLREAIDQYNWELENEQNIEEEDRNR